MTTLYFLRHGETDFNRQGIVQGGGIDSSLNELGARQAHRFFESYRHVKFDALYISQLQRTYQTLALWEPLGYILTKEAALNEFNWGIHEGRMPTPEHKAAFKDMLHQWASGNLLAKVEKGENPLEAWERARGFFSTLPEKHADQTLLLCTHGRQLRVILSNLLDQDMRFMEKYSHSNTGLTIVRWEEKEKPHLVKLNDSSHLIPELLLKEHD